MAITVAELSVAMRLSSDASTPPDEPTLSMVHRQLQTSAALIDRFLNGGAIDDFVRDEAIIRLSAYLWDQPPTGNVSQNPMRHSGCLALLSPFANFEGSSTATIPETPVMPPVATIPETTLTPSTHIPHPGRHLRYIGWSDGPTVSAGDLATGVQFTADALTVPARGSDGYIWAAFDESVGFPDSCYIDGNPTNIIGGWRRQPGTLARDGVNYDVLVTNSEQSSRSAGRIYTFGYMS